MENAKRKTYPQNWAVYNLAQTTEKAKFQELLFELCANVEDLPRQPGAGRNRLPLSEMIFCVVFKIYSLVSGRRFISDLQEAQRRGFITRAPHFNSIFNYLESEVMTDILKDLITQSSLPLKSIEVDFAVDSSGFSTSRYVSWFNVKHGKKVEDWHDWVKAHLMCGVKTNIVTSVEISHRYANDSPYLKPLLEKTVASGFQPREVSGDKGYDSHSNRCLILVKGADPYIPFRETRTGASPSYKGELWKRMYHFYKFNEAEFNAHYHKRSNVESTFSMIKAKFSDRLRSKTQRAQINEVLCKILCHNLCCVIGSIYELGIEANFINSGESQ